MRIETLIILLLLSSSYSFSQSVGVGTTDPKATLHVVGGMAIREADYAVLTQTTDSNTGAVILPDQKLFWDIKTGEVKTIANEDFGFPFYSMDYELVCYIYPGGNASQDPAKSDATLRDLIKDFNTKIDNKYEVFLTDVYPTPYVHYNRDWSKLDTDPDYLGIKHVKYQQDLFHGGTDTEGPENFKNVDELAEVGKYGNDKERVKNTLNPIRKAICYRDKRTGTWHISIDYIMARPPQLSNNHRKYSVCFTYQVNLFIIDPSYCNRFDNLSGAVEGGVYPKGAFKSNPLKK